MMRSSLKYHLLIELIKVFKKQVIIYEYQRAFICYTYSYLWYLYSIYYIYILYIYYNDYICLYKLIIVIYADYILI